MGSATKIVSYRYDAARNRTLMIDPDGGRTTYAYDALDRLISLINPQGERTTYAYDPKGRRTVKELANGTRASFTYDAANRLTTLANLRSDNTVISKFDYKYDNVGNRTEVVEADGSRVTWSYDPTSQLTAEHRTGSVPYRNTFTYDSVGNRLVKNETGARTTYSYDAANQLKTSIDAGGITTFTFDPNGNQHLVQTPNGDRTTTVWDYENKATLVELPSGIRNTMAYEPDGLRVKLEESTGTKKFIWDHQNYLAESDENNDINVLYTNEPNYYGNLISQYRKSGAVWAPSYYHYEALGSTRQLTNNTAAITDQYLYDAWGNVISSSGSTVNPFQFTGKVGYYFDVDTGNQYIRARIYSPTIGRWTSLDPIPIFVASSFPYAQNNPLRWVDPSGLIKTVVGPLATMVSWIDDFHPDIYLEDIVDAYTEWSNANMQPITPFTAHSVATALGELSNSANPKPPNFLMGPDWKDFVDSKEYRAFMNARLKICCDDGIVIQSSVCDQSNSFGWTPIRLVNRDSTPITYDKAEGRGPFTIGPSKGGTCSRFRMSTWQRIGPIGQAVAKILTGVGVPWVVTTIDYELCCGGSYTIKFAGSHFPSHKAYINRISVGSRIQQDLPEFIFAGGGVPVPATVFKTSSGSASPDEKCGLL